MIYLLRLSWFISLGISLIGFLIIGNMFTIRPDGTLENESLGFVGIIFVLPFILLSLFTTFRYFHYLTKSTNDRLMKSLSIVGGFILIFVLIYFTIDYKNEVIESLGGPSTNVNSTIYNLPLLNAYTNTIFFNFYTFALIHSIFGLIGAFMALIRPEMKKEELPE